jgi:hypothetical protein
MRAVMLLHTSPAHIMHFPGLGGAAAGHSLNTLVPALAQLLLTRVPRIPLLSLLQPFPTSLQLESAVRTDSMRRQRYVTLRCLRRPTRTIIAVRIAFRLAFVAENISPKVSGGARDGGQH